MNKYLVINGGSSSLKFSLYENNEEGYNEIVSGVIERIGQEKGAFVLKCENKIIKDVIVKNHTEAVNIMLDTLLERKYLNSIDDIKGIGHRVLHGGEYYSDSVIIDEESLKNIKSLIPFGPLHLPGEISVIESMLEILPNVQNVAVFDTAFHQTISLEKILYGVPLNWYKKYGIRKYGFHGTSHKYITEALQEKLGKKDVNIINCHLGNGSSICAIKNGKSFDTTMGFTPLDGVIMGTRSGSIDASIVKYMCDSENISVGECFEILNKQSGLYGLSEVSSDVRDILAARSNGNKKAAIALEKLEEDIKKYIGQYFFELDGKIDAIVFTAGIGENVPSIRKSIIDKISKIDVLGIKLDNELNEIIKNGKTGKITTNDSKTDFYVIPTNEEYMILKDTIRLSNEYNLNSKKLLKVKK